MRRTTSTKTLHMKMISLHSVVAAIASAVLLGACGGGGDEAGSLTEFTVSPAEISWTGPTGSCYQGVAGLVNIYGGAAPYQISVTSPAGVAVRAAGATDDPVNNRQSLQVDHPASGFIVVYTNGAICLDGAIINVTDKLGRLVTVDLTNEEGS